MITVPTGYHLSGSTPTAWPSKLLRPYRDKISRQEFYRDCYYVESPKLWKCCISNCNDNDVVMYQRPNSTASEFQNFYSHLTVRHPNMLSGDDFLKWEAEKKKTT